MAGSSLQKGIERNYYADLNLPQTASAEEIKTRYRKLALTTHPDKNPADKKANERFGIIQTAYEILSDPELKAKYDAGRPKKHPTSWQPNQARAGTTPRPAQGQGFYHYTEFKGGAKNGAQPYMRATATGGERRAPHPPPPRTARARQRAEASFCSRTDLRDEPPAKTSNYRSPHIPSRRASTPVPDASAQAPPPAPQRPIPTVETDPPDTVNPRTMENGDSNPETSLPPHQPTDPPEPPKPRQQPAKSKQSSSTIPMSSAGQDTTEEGQPGNTPNFDEKRPDKPETLFNLDEE
ncbi:hypothetical protein FPRO04_14556, partial [Fusarium proliferatum]